MKPTQPVYLLVKAEDRTIASIDPSFSHLYVEIKAVHPDAELPDRELALARMRAQVEVKATIDDVEYVFERRRLGDLSL